MALCTACGVQIEAGHQKCPLCSSPLSGDDQPMLPADRAFSRRPEFETTPDDALKRRLGLAAFVLGTVLVPSALVCVLIDLMYAGGGWSRLVVAVLTLVLGLGLTPRLFFPHVMVIGLADAGLIGIALVALDLIGPWQGWSLRVGLPIVIWVAIGVVLGWLALRLYRNRTGFVLATFLGVVLILCLVVDAAVSADRTGGIHLVWSLITAAIVGPLILTSVILQLVLPSSDRLQRFLHW